MTGVSAIPLKWPRSFLPRSSATTNSTCFCWVCAVAGSPPCRVTAHATMGRKLNLSVIVHCSTDKPSAWSQCKLEEAVKRHRQVTALNCTIPAAALDFVSDTYVASTAPSVSVLTGQDAISVCASNGAARIDAITARHRPASVRSTRTCQQRGVVSHLSW